jgi:hypothetical protein
MLRGGWVIKEGTAVGFLLVWCGRSATTLVAAGHKNKTTKRQNDKTTKRQKITPGSRLKSITGKTIKLPCVS